MSAATASSTETIFVRLLGEGVDVWRPVRATALGQDTFRLEPDPAPPDEEWEFRPGDLVRVEERDGGTGPVKVARALASLRVRRAS